MARKLPNPPPQSQRPPPPPPPPKRDKVAELEEELALALVERDYNGAKWRHFEIECNRLQSTIDHNPLSHLSVYIEKLRQRIEKARKRQSTFGG